MLLFTAGLFGGCRIGTIDEDELLADYEVQWKTAPEDFLEELEESLEARYEGVPYALKEVSLHGNTASVEIREIGSRRVYSHWYLYRSPFRRSLTRGDLDEANDPDPDGTLFSFDDIPIEDLEEMIDLTRAESPFRPASLNSIRFERDDEGEMLLEVSVNVHTVGDSHHRVFYEGQDVSAIPAPVEPNFDEQARQPEEPEERSEEPASAWESISVGDPQIDGDMDATIISRILDRRTRAILACTTRGRASDFELNFVIDGSGQVINASVIPQGTLDPSVRPCIVRETDRLRPPDPSGSPLSGSAPYPPR